MTVLKLNTQKNQIFPLTNVKELQQNMKTWSFQQSVRTKNTLYEAKIIARYHLNFAVVITTYQQACIPQWVNAFLMLPWAKSFVFLYFLVLETTANQKTFHILNIDVLGKSRNWFSPVPKLLQVWKPRCFLVVDLITTSLFPRRVVATSWDVQLVANNAYQSFFPQSCWKAI